MSNCLSCGITLSQPRKRNQHKHYCTAACYDKAMHRRFRTVEVQPMNEDVITSDTVAMAAEHSPYAGLFDPVG